MDNSLSKYVHKARNRFKTLSTTVRRKLDRRVLGVAWLKGKNFGDQLTFDVFQHFGLKALHEPRFVLSNAIGVGSILQHVPNIYSGAVLGAGLISENYEIQLPYAELILVRGHLTRDRIQSSKTTLLGDPGLLVDRIYKRELAKVEKKGTIGIVLHHQHQFDPIMLNMIGRLQPDVKVIDVLKPPGQVITEIAECSHIISSSLHGLIVADSLGIPNRWLKLTNELIGDSFKFEDYYSAYGIDETPIKPGDIEIRSCFMSATTLKPISQINRVKHDIQSAFQVFASNWL